MNNSAKTIAQDVLKGRSRAKPIALEKLKDIETEFRETQIDEANIKALVVIYGSGGERAAVMYPFLSGAKINVLHSSRFTPEDFKTVLSNYEVIGDIRPASIQNRIKEERNTLVASVVVFIIALIFLTGISSPSAMDFGNYLSNPSAYPGVENLLRFYALIGQALLTIMTLFFTVFILFTISQNSELSKDKNLYRIGYFHKYIRDDRYISFIAGVSLATSTIGLLLASSPIQILTSSNPQINELNTVVPLCFAIALSTFFTSIASLSAYSRRVIWANESNLLNEIFVEQAMVTQSVRDAQQNQLARSRVNGAND